MVCICVRCGKEFACKRKTSICDDCKIQKCVVCGKEFELQWPYTAVTCSSKCRGEYRKQTGKGKEIAKKAKETLQNHYGVSNASVLQHTKPKKCAYCGEEFYPESARQKYCKRDHYGPCPVCGKPVLIKRMDIGPQCCSEECRQKAIEATCLEKYGCTSAVNSEHARQLAKNTIQEKYGVDHYSKTSEYKEKYKATMLERYGVENPLQSKEIQDKVKSTNLSNLGVEYPTQCDSVKEKVKQTCDERYNGIGLQSPEIRSKIENTNLQRYNFKNPMQNPDIFKKAQNTNLQKYGASSYFQTRDRFLNVILNPAKVDEYLKFRSDPKSYILSHYSKTPSCAQMCEDIGVSDTTVYYILIKNNCRDLVTFHQSSMETELVDYLYSLNPNIVISKCDRSIITPQEIDIYLPEYKLGFECNPTYTHNSSFPTCWEEYPKSRNYHRDKTLACQAGGVTLIHIFGYEWSNHKDIVKSRIANMLGMNTKKYYARKLKLKEVPYEESKSFLTENHLQGYVSCGIRLGLYFDNELISLMTFSKPRGSLGYSKSYGDGVYELTRFCTKLFTTCVGGASKLFKYFLNIYHPKQVISFSNLSNTTGTVYSILGFKSAGIVSPGYVWVDLQTDKYLTRVQCQKSKLKKLFNQPFLNIENKTEVQVMQEHGFVQVFNSGLVKWVWGL